MSTTARYWQLVHLSVSQKIKIQQSELAKYAELEIWDRAQREAARRRKSDWKDNFGGTNSARSNATWRMNFRQLTQYAHSWFRMRQHARL